MMLRFLNKEIEEHYYETLKSNYLFLERKYKIPKNIFVNGSFVILRAQTSQPFGCHNWLSFTTKANRFFQN
jgi:hypothetical protein